MLGLHYIIIIIAGLIICWSVVLLTLFSRSTNPEDPGDERKSSQPTPENAASLPSGSLDAACGSILEEGGELAHREGGAGGGDSSESEGEDPSKVAETEESLRTDRIKLPPDEIAAISAGKQLANKVLMANKEYPYGPRK